MRRYLFFALLFLAFANSAEAQTSDSARTLQLVNQARESSGLVPLALNPQLTAAAQAHADDLARNGVGLGHVGSDGSTPALRIGHAGYRSYSWGLLVGENWAAYLSVETAMAFWLNDPPHRANILDYRFREIGIGMDRSPDGALVLITDFGAQPNVLPVFAGWSDQVVTLTLSNEDAEPAGDGPAVIGKAVTVDISSFADLSGASTRPYSRQIVLPAPGATVPSPMFVRFHDAQGRTVISSSSPDGFSLAPGNLTLNAPVLSPSPSGTTTPRPTLTRTRRPPTPTLTETPTGTSTLTETASPQASRTSTPAPRRVSPPPTRAAAPVPVGLDAMTREESILAGGLFGTAGLLGLVALRLVLHKRG